jgi:hypothetical protein
LPSTPQNILSNVLKKQKDWYSGKKGQHTIKTQLIIGLVTRTIIGLAQAEGKVHDFQLFKDDIGNSLWEDILMTTDSGYQGIEKLHPNSQIPIKKQKEENSSNWKKPIIEQSQENESPSNMSIELSKPLEY